MGQSLNYLIKGDDAAKYPTFSQVIDAFKKNDQYKYYLVTSSKNVPEGSELYKKNLEDQVSGKKPQDEAFKNNILTLKIYYYGRNGS